MKNKILVESLRIARKHLPHHPCGDCWMHWSFIVVRNVIVEWGTNLRGNTPIHYGYNKKIDVEYPALIHSEIHAYRKASKLLGKKLTSFDVVNVRLNRRGETKMSCPCKCCYPWMQEMGAKIFYFTTDVGWGKMT